MNNNTDFLKDNEIVSLHQEGPGGAPSTKSKRTWCVTCAMIFGIVGMSCLALVVMLFLLFKQDLLVMNHMIKGLSYSDQGDFDHALKEFNQALEIHPNSVFADQVHFYRGITYARVGVLDLAIADFNDAIRLNPTFLVAYTKRGFAYLGKGELERALDDFDKAISLDPDFADSYFGRGVVYFNQGKYDRAVADFSRTIELAPAFTEVYFWRGHAYIRAEAYDLAVADCDQFIEQNPDNAAALNNRCWSYFKMGRYEQALPDCEKSIELDPDDVNTLDSRARVYKALGRTEEAIADFERIIELGTNNELSQQAAEELRDIDLSEESQQQPRNADAITGIWSGSASGGSLTFQITVTIKSSCVIGSVCGPFNIPAIPCSGTFILINVTDDTYSFRTGDIQGSCGKAYSDTLTLLPDGALLYVSKGEYGESIGILQLVK